MKRSRCCARWLSRNLLVLAAATSPGACGTGAELESAGATTTADPALADPATHASVASPLASAMDPTSDRDDDAARDAELVAGPIALARTPPMGFNDWNAFGCDVSEQLIKDTADLFVSSGLKDAGYQYVNIDDCWALRERGPDGRLVPDPQKFPSGIAGTAAYVHGLGLKLGIYADAGTATCAGYPGSLGHEQIDADTFAQWGVDYLKYDNCNNNSDGSRADFIRRYAAMASALGATGRPIVYSICEWGEVQPWEWAGELGNLWRTTGDISDSWASMSSIIAQNAPLFWAARPGAWNDPDMLEIGNGGMTTTEYETHFAMWSMMAAPLLIGTDLRKATPDTLRILSNRELIAIDQDPLGVQAQVLYHLGDQMVLARPLANGDRAIALYNASAAPATIRIRAVQTGLPVAPAYRLKEVWTGELREAASVIAATVAPHATVVYRAAPLDRPGALPPATTLGVALANPITGVSVPAVIAGQVTPVTATLGNLGAGTLRALRLTVVGPPGWSVTAQGDTSARALVSGGSFAANWSVGVPPTAAVGTYDLTVTATYTFGRRRTAASATAAIRVQVVTPPPAGAARLSSLPWLSVTNGWGPAELDTSNGEQAAGDGNPITINGRVYAHGIGAHAPGEIVYYLGGRCSALTTDVGLDDEKSQNGSAAFRIYADDRLVADSGTRTVNDPAMTLTADLRGAIWLRLVTDPGPSTDSDHTDWAEPTLTCAP